MANESYVFTDVVGQDSFTINAFPLGSDQVYLNGAKLIRGVDYSVTISEDLLTKSIVLDPTLFPTGMLSASAYLEILVPDTISDAILVKLEDIATAVMGSWIWNKGDGLLTMLDKNGTERFKFTVEDSSELSSRERRQDLEA